MRFTYARTAMALIPRHRAFAAVLALALLFRGAVAVVHRPALFFSDSWNYLDVAYAAWPSGFSATRPSGYPVLLRLLSEPFGLHPAGIAILQHLAGLAGGGVVYAGLVALGLRKGWAAAASAVVLLDFYAIALEQHLLAEAFFTLALVGALALTVWGRGRTWPLVAAGVLLAAAVLLRTVGLFLVPVWLLYLLWARAGLRATVAATAALALPLAGYLVIHERKTGHFSFIRAGGWFLYGRIGEISDCEGVDVAPEARPLCEARPPGGTVSTYLWNPASPAWRLFGHGPGGEESNLDEENHILGGFARDVIAARPGRYATLVLADFARFFAPGVGSHGRTDTTIELPRSPADVVVVEPLRERFLPGYQPRMRSGSGVLADVGSVLHTPRWLLALLALAGAVAVVRRGPHRREVVLLTGGALAMLLGSAATSEMEVRYLIPCVPLLVAGGALAVHDLARARAA